MGSVNFLLQTGLVLDTCFHKMYHNVVIKSFNFATLRTYVKTLGDAELVGYTGMHAVIGGLPWRKKDIWIQTCYTSSFKLKLIYLSVRANLSPIKANMLAFT